MMVFEQYSFLFLWIISRISLWYVWCTFLSCILTLLNCIVACRYCPKIHFPPFPLQPACPNWLLGFFERRCWCCALVHFVYVLYVPVCGCVLILQGLYCKWLHFRVYLCAHPCSSPLSLPFSCFCWRMQDRVSSPFFALYPPDAFYGRMCLSSWFAGIRRGAWRPPCHWMTSFSGSSSQLMTRATCIVMWLGLVHT